MKVLKNFESSNFYKKSKRSIKFFAGLEPKIKIKRNYDVMVVGDWGFLKDKINKNSVVYSFGVGDDVDFDLAIQNFSGCKVFCFDPTIDGSIFTSEKRNKKLEFYPWAIADSDGEVTLYERLKSDGMASGMFTVDRNSSVSGNSINVPAFTLRSIMKKLGHTKIDLIKLDVEGAEFAVLESMLGNGLLPEQILVEFHHRFKDFSVKDVKRILRKLEGLRYDVAYVTPTGREVTFVRVIEQ